MSAKTRRRIGPGVLLLALAGLLVADRPSPTVAQAPPGLGLACTLGTPGPGGEVVFDLQATSGYAQMADGNVVFMWSFAPAGGAFQYPGPVLCVNQGQVVMINLTNALGENVSLVFPGQGAVTNPGSPGVDDPDTLTHEAVAGGSAVYQFTASQPGTYLYESGTQPHKQVHMGLFGTLVVRPSMGSNFAYNDATTQFSAEYLLVLHEIDPNLHSAVEQGLPFDDTQRRDRYWTINGRSMPDLLFDNSHPLFPDQPYGALVRVTASDPATPDLPILVRYANAGSVNHPFHPHGNHLRVIAQDGRLLGAAAVETFTKTVAAGQTNDLLFRWTNVEGWTPGPNGFMPVTLPGLLDLVFKDSTTFYSGDPHLGFVGELPPTVAVFNECGEFYFPWHSHALQTVQNFDEGFGGMHTLVRVDPPQPNTCF